MLPPNAQRSVKVESTLSDKKYCATDVRFCSCNRPKHRIATKAIQQFSSVFKHQKKLLFWNILSSTGGALAVADVFGSASRLM